MEKRKLAQSAVAMGIIILFSKFLGLVRDILVASSFGTTEASIAYETASKLPITVFDFILGGVVTSAFIPVYNSIVVKKGKREALSFAQSYVNLILLITSVIALVGIVFSSELVSLVAPSLPESTASLARSLTVIMFPMVIFVGLAFSFVGFLQSEGEYNIPAIISLVSNVIMIAYLVFFSDSFGVRGLSYAMLVGWGMQAAVQLPAVLKKGFRPSLRASLAAPEIKRAAKNTLPILIATWTNPICTIINTRVASGIDSGRAIGALGYANRIYIIIVGIFSFVATNLLFPYLAKAAAEGKRDEGDRLTRLSIKALAFIVVPISLGVAVLAEDFISLIYERGVFTSSDTEITAQALRAYSFGMLFTAVCEVLTKAFFAVEKTVLPMIASTVSIIFNVLLLSVLEPSINIGGIALLSGASAGINMLICLVFAYRKKLISFDGHDYRDIAKTLLSSAVMAAAVYFTSRALTSLPTVASFFASVGVGIAVYFVLVLLLRHDALEAFFGGGIKLKGKKK